MSDRVVAWVWRAAVLAAPLAVHPVIGHHSHAVRLTGETLAWAGWAAVLLATLVVHPAGLVVLRCITVAAAVATLVSLRLSSGGIATAAYCVLLALAALLPRTGEWFVNGPAYPNERRFMLRPPGPLLIGPVEIAGLVAPAGPIAGAVLLAGRRWVLGGITLAVGLAAVVVLGRALYGLTQRWVVFVPAGLVLHDPVSLDAPTLVRRAEVAALGPALAVTDTTDLRRGAPGLAVEIAFNEPIDLAPHSEVDRVLVAPTRPGALVAEAARRHLAVRAS